MHNPKVKSRTLFQLSQPGAPSLESNRTVFSIYGSEENFSLKITFRLKKWVVLNTSVR